ncbi:hypothetical protein CTRG_06074 [Candida tropicalis MYA-3404]|uniref:Glutamyl-tRNA(Gln) amidotransferase subunit A, mitochondrial n=1 Tax=Candida tropicalis (strain ATCC MYA-3404 / T1) TaxID=294747 RepID=C5MJ31_CANTT|nr:hypothetical protein CTRG_06074 [Candida tropicalis MYA-3404]EER30290.1 hypothetical protein CTRG_06074 [Candida tropicalis MYA-3404]KAG4404246.1 hypothetical protein JTP64_001213 [Candida tropicalis]
MIKLLPATKRSIRCLTTTSSTHELLDKWNCLISTVTIEPTSTGPLSGTKYILKDNIVTKNSTSTAASKTLSNYKSPFNATIVDLLSSQGSTLVGKSNLDEFGMGSANLNSYFGPVINPQDKPKITGGSSGGSAAAVSSGICDFSIGTDTGGSVRLPASYCQVFGFKPTYGRISRWGVIPYAQTLDTVGILGNNIDIIHEVYNVLNKYDEKDPTSLPEEVRNKIDATINTEKLVIGIPEEFILDELSDAVRNSWKEILVRLQEQGHEIKPISIGSIKKSLPAYYTLATAEAASNLSRYDGIRYGDNSQNQVETASDLIFSNRSTNFGPEVQRRIILGNYTLSSDSGDHYLRATEIRRELCIEFSTSFKKSHILLQDGETSTGVDLIIAPTATKSAPNVDEFVSENEENFLNGYVNDVLTVPASLTGIPTISIPFNGIGIQLMGQFGDDELVLQVAKDLSN